uniref:Uncharacterized protein n=1 Tax=Panagrolaimus davidi TaxID=227884 RepID=A0A914QCE9_9BILA
MSSRSLMDNESNAALVESNEAENQTENVETPPPQNRKKFILRVFSIAAFMIFVCLFIGVILNLSIEIQFKNPLNSLIFVCLQSVCFYVAILVDCYQQKSPWNLILLSIFAAFSALIVASHISFYDFPLIIAAFITTILVSVVSILYGIYTKIDYTNFWEFGICFYIVSYACYWILAMVGLFEFNIPEFYRIYCILNSLLRMLTLVFDVQQIMGKMIFKFHEEEICVAILAIFVDVLYLLLFMLASIGDFGSGNGLNILFNIFVHR